MTFKIAIKHLLSKPFLSLFTLAAVAGALSILGVFWTVVENMERVRVPGPLISENQVSPSAANEVLPGLTVFLESKTSEADVKSLQESLAEDARFSRVEVVAAEEALKGLEEQFGETLSRAFSADSLPITLKLHFSSSTMTRDSFLSLLNEVRALPGVLDVDDGLMSFEKPEEKLSSGLFTWATGLLIVVFLIVALLVSHLIRIAFETLRPEVETLKVLGASRFWIFKPLFLEGLFMGVFGALASLGVLAVFVEWVLPKLAATLLPRNLEIVGLSPEASLQLFLLSVGASILGALFTWPLIDQPPTEI